MLLIERRAKSASGTASRLPATFAGSATAPGTPPPHQLTRPGPPGAAREPPGPPNGRTPAAPSRTVAGNKLSNRKIDEKAAAPPPERASAAAVTAAAMPGVGAVPMVPLAAVPAPLAAPERHIQGSVSVLEGGSRAAQGRLGVQNGGRRAAAHRNGRRTSSIDPGLPPPDSNAAPGVMVASQPWPRRASRLLLLRAPAGSL